MYKKQKILKCIKKQKNFEVKIGKKDQLTCKQKNNLLAAILE